MTTRSLVSVISLAVVLTACPTRKEKPGHPRAEKTAQVEKID